MTDNWPAYLRLRSHIRGVERGLPRLRPASGAGRRLLAIWDFRECPSNIGDILVLHERLELLRGTEGYDKVDFALVGEAGHILANNRFYTAGIDDDNWRDPLPGLLRTVNAYEHAGSSFFFDSYEALDAFIAASHERYRIVPSAREYDAPQASYSRNFDAIQDHFLQHGCIPPLPLRRRFLVEAARFLREHVAPAAALVCQIRNNRLRPDDRNAPLDVWEEFIAGLNGRSDVRVVLVGAANEIDDRFRRLPNVVVAKDHGTSLEVDLALVNTAAMFMGSPSGPACLAYFSETPYVVVNYLNAHETIQPGNDFVFCSDRQHLTWERETAEILRGWFDRLWPRCDPPAWHDRVAALAAGGASWTKLAWDRG